jgi:hypothetical protein
MPGWRVASASEQAYREHGGTPVPVLGSHSKPPLHAPVAHCSAPGLSVVKSQSVLCDSRVKRILDQGRCCLHTPRITNLGQIRPPPSKASQVRPNHHPTKTPIDIQDSSTSNVQEVPGGASHPVGVLTGFGPTEVNSPGQTVYGPVAQTLQLLNRSRRGRYNTHTSWRPSSCASWR